MTQRDWPSFIAKVRVAVVAMQAEVATYREIVSGTALQEATGFYVDFADTRLADDLRHLDEHEAWEAEYDSGPTTWAHATRETLRAQTERLAKMLGVEEKG